MSDDKKFSLIGFVFGVFIALILTQFSLPQIGKIYLWGLIPSFLISFSVSGYRVIKNYKRGRHEIDNCPPESKRRHYLEDLTFAEVVKRDLRFKFAIILGLGSVLTVLLGVVDLLDNLISSKR